MADQGPAPFVTDIERATLDNTMFRDTLWTGQHLQLTVMAIPPGGEIGLEMHDDTDQFLRVEAGRGLRQPDRLLAGVRHRRLLAVQRDDAGRRPLPP